MSHLRWAFVKGVPNIELLTLGTAIMVLDEGLLCLSEHGEAWFVSLFGFASGGAGGG